MEEQITRETKQMWKFSMDATKIINENVVSEDRMHTSKSFCVH